ncbi:MAG: ribonuclease HIII [bacterium]
MKQSEENNLKIQSMAISRNKIELFKDRLETEGFSFTGHESNRFLKWRAKRDGLTINVYNTGKIVLQGKGIESFLADTDIWSGLMESQNDSEDLVGIDEAGKGDYFGPLVVAAVLVRSRQWNELAMKGIRDSKSMSDAQVLRLSSEIKKACPHSLVVISPERYNNLYQKIKNLNRLLAWGHARALENILNHWEVSRALSDQFGDKSLLLSALMEKGKSIQLMQTPKAEKNLAVAAASILARNEFLTRLSALGETYGTVFPKGAGSQVVQAGRRFFKEHGSEDLARVAKIHFKTTREVRALQIG